MKVGEQKVLHKNQEFNIKTVDAKGEKSARRR